MCSSDLPTVIEMELQDRRDPKRHYVSIFELKGFEWKLTGLQVKAAPAITTAANPLIGKEAMAEFGVSVSSHARGRGYGARMFERAVMHARNEGVTLMFIHALSENAAMIWIARNAGATIERDGSETEAYLRLPPPDLESELEDWVSDQYGRMNYTLKEQVQEAVDTVAQVQEIRQAVREGRHKSGSYSPARDGYFAPPEHQQT